MVKISFVRMRRMIRTTERLEWRRIREMARATNGTALLSKFPKGQRNTSHVEDCAVRMMELDEAYREVFSDLQEMRDMLAPLIDSLENPDDRAVMRLRYLDGLEPADIAQEIFRTERMVYYVIRRSERDLIWRYPEYFSEFQ